MYAKEALECGFVNKVEENHDVLLGKIFASLFGQKMIKCVYF
jgi:hypothetical protein